MNINVNYSVAVKFGEFLDVENYKNANYREPFVEYLKKNESFNKQFNFHKDMTVSDYFRIIFTILDEKPLKLEKTTEKVMYNSFKHILSKKSVMKTKIMNLQNYDFSKLENKLLETLPQNTSLDTNIHVVVDGFNAGSILDNNNMLIDAMFWPLEKKNENQIEGIILHELHHIGLLYWLEKNEKRRKILQEKSGFEISVRLVEQLIGEGSATYLFNQNDDLTDLIKEAYGDTLAQQYKESIKKSKEDINVLLKKLEADLEYLMNDNMNYDAMKIRKRKYSFCEELGQPLDKAIGAYMCETIEKSYGRKELIKIFKNPHIFLEKYNESAGKLSRLELNEGVVQNWMKQWK